MITFSEIWLFSYLELSDFMRLINVYAPCTTILNQTSPLLKLLDKYKSNENDYQYELDFSYLKPFTSYTT